MALYNKYSAIKNGRVEVKNKNNEFIIFGRKLNLRFKDRDTKCLRAKLQFNEIRQKLIFRI